MRAYATQIEALRRLGNGGSQIVREREAEEELASVMASLSAACLYSCPI